MSKFKLVRIDFRLIHGQVITKWLKQSGADKIVIIDDLLASDTFMKSIYTMSAPPGIPVDVYSVEEAGKKWAENHFGSDKILLLFKDVATTYKMFSTGLPLPNIQIGGLGAGPDRKKVYGPISLSQADYELLKEMHDQGIEIVLHQVPDEAKMEFSKVIQRF